MIKNFLKLNDGLKYARYAMTVVVAISIIIMWCAPVARYFKNDDESSKFLIKYSIHSGLNWTMPIGYFDYVEIGEICSEPSDRLYDVKLYNDAVEVVYLRKIEKVDDVESGFTTSEDLTVNCIKEKVAEQTRTALRSRMDALVLNFSDDYADLLFDLKSMKERSEEKRVTRTQIKKLLQDNLLTRFDTHSIFTDPRLVDVRKHDLTQIPLNTLKLNDWVQIIAANLIGTILSIIIIVSLNLKAIRQYLRSV